jgi:branched-chain amino acid transport system substrate-binding protein
MEDKITLDIQDDTGAPSEGLAAISRMSDKGIKYVIGPGLSTVAEAVVPMLKSRGMYMISPSVSTSSLAEKNDNFARTIPYNSKAQANQIAGYLVKRLGIKDAVILYDARNSSYSTDVVRNITSAFMFEGCNIRDIRAFNPEAGESMNELISKDKGNAPDLYYIVGAPLDSALIIWQIRKSGYQSKIAIRGWAAGKEFLRFGGEAVNGVYLFDYYIDKQTNNYIDFRKEYQAKYNEEPSWMSAHGYETGLLLFSSMKELSNDASFIDTISGNIKKVKLFSNMTMDKYGDTTLPLNAFIIKEGRIERLGAAQ